MKIAGILLLLAGWGIVLFAVSLLPATATRTSFVLAGVGVEGLGLGLLIRSHPVPRGEGG